MQFIVQGYPAYAYTGGRPFAPAPGAVVFIHGAAFDHSVWQWQARSLAHHGHAVLAPDLPAHGRSPGDPRTTIEALSDWIAALIEAAGLASAHVVGHSMGSLVALDLALRHRHCVDRLVLLGCAVPMAVGPAFLAAALDDADAAFDMQAVWGHARQVQLAASPVPGVTLLGASRRLNGRARPGVLHADLSACAGYAPLAQAIETLAVPALVAGGQLDAMTPMANVKALAAAIPGAQFTAFATGHSMMSEAPREVTAALHGFLR